MNAQQQEETAPVSEDTISETSAQEQDPSHPGPKKTQPASVSDAHLRSVLESLIFVSDRPVGDRKLARIAKAPVAEVRVALEALIVEYEDRGINLVELASGYQFRSSVANAPFVRDIVARRPIRLTRAQLETLAIAAYRQPLTKPELEEIRGVDSSSALKVLLERGLLKILGRKEEAGRPLLYGTAPYFLEFFGLKKLDELPTLKEFSELTDESKALFARKTGEDIGSIADIQAEESRWDESDSRLDGVVDDDEALTEDELGERLDSPDGFDDDAELHDAEARAAAVHDAAEAPASAADDSEE